MIPSAHFRFELLEQSQVIASSIHPSLTTAAFDFEQAIRDLEKGGICSARSSI
jgi:hypothetical protein